MIAHWILFYSAFLLPTAIQNVFCQTSESWVLSRISSENTKEVSSPNLLLRQKRAVTNDILEYVVDLEISFSNEQFPALFRNFMYTLQFPKALNASGTNITIQSATITTVCSISGNMMQCPCESGYKWPDEICSKNLPCPSVLSQRCSCISKFPSLEGQYCQLSSSQVIKVPLSLTILDAFTDDLTNPSSETYRKYKSRLEAVFNEKYKILPGFRSTNVTGFRNGSIIADYEILTEHFKAQDIEDANSGVIANLSKYFKLADPPIATVLTHLTNFTVSPETYVEGDNLMLKCETEVNSVNITWLKDSTRIVGNNTNYTIYPSIIQNGISVSYLKIAHVTPFDQGTYTCRLTQSGIIYDKSYNISVQPMTFNKSMDVDILCNGIDVKMLKCCSEVGDIHSFNANWILVSGPSKVSGIPGNSSSCFTYTLRANEADCPAESSGEEITYSCEVKVGNDVKTSKEIKVRFYRNANVTINSNNRNQFSFGEHFSLTCTSDVVNAVSVSWEIINEITKEVTLIDKILYNPISKTNPISLLNVTASMDWNGTYRCNVSQAIVSNFAKRIISVYPLPLPNEITIYPSNGKFDCKVPTTIKCCVIKGDYDVKINIENIPYDMDNSALDGNQVCYIKNYQPKPCNPDTGSFTGYCRFNNSNIKQDQVEVKSPVMTMTRISADKPQCYDSLIGIGDQGDVTSLPCQLKGSTNTGNPMGGNLTYTCNNEWKLTANYCISASIKSLLSIAQGLNSTPQPSNHLAAFLNDLHNTTQQEQNEIQISTGNLAAMVQILSTVSEIRDVNVTENMMENFLSTVNTIVENNTTSTWDNLNKAGKDSSILLRSVENFAKELDIVNSSISITANQNIQLQGITVRNDTSEHYNKSFHFINLTGNVFINYSDLRPNSRIISIAYSTLKEILPKDNNTNASVNGLVMSTLVDKGVNSTSNFSISMTFSVSNSSLQDPKCVFWNFSLSSGKVGWDGTGCQPENGSGNVICVCNHLTSFSILMSPSDLPPIDDHILSIITYIGVGISLGSLVLCIIIEAMVWKSVTKSRTSYIRHVCFVNIAVSLLVADIWFIISAIPDIHKYSDVCAVITFFSHFFYLSLFFWMLSMALKLLYLMIYVFQEMSKSTMLIIAFSLGYGCPLIISAITIAVTQPAKLYTRGTFCWLNVKDSKAFLAFVVPALTIVAVNFIIFLITIIKILRPSVGDRPRREEKSTVVQIAKSVAVLTPLLGLTWGFGLAVVIKYDIVLHAIFAALNSFQGFFIFVYGTLWDRKVREALMKTFRFSRWPSLQTKSTSEGSSEKPKTFSRTINRLFGKTGTYKMSSTSKTSSSGTASDSYSLLT